jgi:hypothetical protein
MVEAVASPCRHHWVLSGPRRGVISGVCKLCRATRDYPARLEDTDRYYDYQELNSEGRPLVPASHDTREES